MNITPEAKQAMLDGPSFIEDGCLKFDNIKIARKGDDMEVELRWGELAVIRYSHEVRAYDSLHLDGVSGTIPITIE